MLFGSDNWAGAAPEISKSLENHAKGHAVAYGDGALDKRVEALFAEVFETQCQVYFVGTGTAANSLALAASMKAAGVAFCHSEAHMIANEAGGPEIASGGGRLCPVDGHDGKISAVELKRIAAQFPQSFNHLGRGTMVSITQTTEAGTFYTLEEISALASIAKENQLALHLDGARFANALVALGCTPAEMTWKRGVDMVSFGATKNGCWCAEALVILNPEYANEAEFIRKRMGHLFSKSRFISAQFEAYFKDGLWLDLAKHSNGIGVQLAGVIERTENTRLVWPSGTNQVFFVADRDKAQKWLDAGAVFHPFPTPKSILGELGENEQIYRLVASFISTTTDVEDLERVLNT